MHGFFAVLRYASDAEPVRHPGTAFSTSSVQLYTYLPCFRSLYDPVVTVYPFTHFSFCAMPSGIRRGGRWRDSGNALLLLRPAEVLADQFVKFLIVFDEKLAQFRHHHRIDPGMLAALRLPQALVAGFVAQTVETLRLVEVEVIATDSGLDSCRDMKKKTNVF